ncbi:hypothetical protein D3C77_292640 [compost metagenome]
MPVRVLITSWVSWAPRSSMITRSATLTDAGVSRAVRPRREPVWTAWSRITPEGCSCRAEIVVVGNWKTACSAQAGVQAPIISTSEVCVLFMTTTYAKGVKAKPESRGACAGSEVRQKALQHQ